MKPSLKAVFGTVRYSPSGDSDGGGAAEARLTPVPRYRILEYQKQIFGPVRPRKEVAPAMAGTIPGRGAQCITARLLRCTHGGHSASPGQLLAMPGLPGSRGCGAAAGEAGNPARRPRGRTTHGQTSQQARAGRGAAGPRPRFIPMTLKHTYLGARRVCGCESDANSASSVHGHLLNLNPPASGLQGRGGRLRRVAGDLAQCADRGGPPGLHGRTHKRPPACAWCNAASRAQTRLCALSCAQTAIAPCGLGSGAQTRQLGSIGAGACCLGKTAVQEAQESGRSVSVRGHVGGWAVSPQIPSVPREKGNAWLTWQNGGITC